LSFYRNWQFVKITTEGEDQYDIDLRDTVGDIFESTSDPKTWNIIVHTAPINRDISVPAGSYLCIAGQKRRLEDLHRADNKRRRFEAERYGMPLDELSDDQPVRSAERSVEPESTMQDVRRDAEGFAMPMMKKTFRYPPSRSELFRTTRPNGAGLSPDPSRSNVSKAFSPMDKTNSRVDTSRSDIAKAFSPMGKPNDRINTSRSNITKDPSPMAKRNGRMLGQTRQRQDVEIPDSQADIFNRDTVEFQPAAIVHDNLDDYNPHPDTEIAESNMSDRRGSISSEVSTDSSREASIELGGDMEARRTLAKVNMNMKHKQMPTTKQTTPAREASVNTQKKTNSASRTIQDITPSSQSNVSITFEPSLPLPPNPVQKKVNATETAINNHINNSQDRAVQKSTTPRDSHSKSKTPSQVKSNLVDKSAAQSNQKYKSQGWSNIDIGNLKISFKNGLRAPEIRTKYFATRSLEDVMAKMSEIKWDLIRHEKEKNDQEYRKARIALEDEMGSRSTDSTQAFTEVEDDILLSSRLGSLQMERVARKYFPRRPVDEVNTRGKKIFLRVQRSVREKFPGEDVTFINCRLALDEDHQARINARNDVINADRLEFEEDRAVEHAEKEKSIAAEEKNRERNKQHLQRVDLLSRVAREQEKEQSQQFSRAFRGLNDISPQFRQTSQGLNDSLQSRQPFQGLINKPQQLSQASQDSINNAQTRECSSRPNQTINSQTPDVIQAKRQPKKQATDKARSSPVKISDKGMTFGKQNTQINHTNNSSTISASQPAPANGAYNALLFGIHTAKDGELFFPEPEPFRMSTASRSSAQDYNSKYHTNPSNLKNAALKEVAVVIPRQEIPPILNQGNDDSTVQVSSASRRAERTNSNHQLHRQTTLDFPKANKKGKDRQFVEWQNKQQGQQFDVDDVSCTPTRREDDYNNYSNNDNDNNDGHNNDYNDGHNNDYNDKDRGYDNNDRHSPSSQLMDDIRMSMNTKHDNGNNNNNNKNNNNNNNNNNNIQSELETSVETANRVVRESTEEILREAMIDESDSQHDSSSSDDDSSSISNDDLDNTVVIKEKASDDRRRREQADYRREEHDARIRAFTQKLTGQSGGYNGKILQERPIMVPPNLGPKTIVTRVEPSQNNDADEEIIRFLDDEAEKDRAAQIVPDIEEENNLSQDLPTIPEMNFSNKQLEYSQQVNTQSTLGDMRPPFPSSGKVQKLIPDEIVDNTQMDHSQQDSTTVLSSKLPISASQASTDLSLSNKEQSQPMTINNVDHNSNKTSNPVNNGGNSKSVKFNLHHKPAWQGRPKTALAKSLESQIYHHQTHPCMNDLKQANYQATKIYWLNQDLKNEIERERIHRERKLKRRFGMRVSPRESDSEVSSHSVESSSSSSSDSSSE